MNKNLHRYSPELLDHIKEKAGYLLYFFGYVDLEDNPTGYFKYEKHKDEDLKQNYGFREFNNENIKFVLKNSDIAK